MIGKRGMEWQFVVKVIIAVIVLLFIILVSRAGAEEIRNLICKLPWC
jgi:hypothetical protein